MSARDSTTGSEDATTAWTHATTEDDEYTVRLYTSSDRRGFLSLYDTVFGDGSQTWFEWKYVEDPYSDHVPIVIATHNGTVVGAKSCMSFHFSVPWTDKPVLALQPGDTMVHPDHRRRGLYSQMTEYLKAHYADRDPGLFFNFPNPATLAGSRKHGWFIIGNLPTFYRIHDPSSMLAGVFGESTSLRFAARLGAPLARTLLALHDQLRLPEPNTAVRVTRHTTVPVETLATIYQQEIPDRVHAIRDEAFYRWRFDNPNWTYRVYVAWIDESPRTGLVVGARSTGSTRIARLTDVVPLSSGEKHIRGFEALLAEVIRDYRNVESVAVAGGAIPPDVLARFGFLSGESFPLSLAASETPFVAYPLSETVASNDDELTDPSNWALMYSDMDTS